ncbi:hypothetical protein OUZ56_013439 [Daphnia magna]|uniref:Uncharacterized protein n=1 Tax=Daphnia magna TaxID=35525 RepID=A0ABQ9Z5Z2_9CRUS|nr:hypothetical protein OUZ56_013439 [Daphnia magna]
MRCHTFQSQSGKRVNLNTQPEQSNRTSLYDSDQIFYYSDSTVKKKSQSGGNRQTAIANV